MEVYSFDGIYKYKGRKNDFEGVIRIDLEGLFNGEIFDFGSIKHERDIKGHIIENRRNIYISFIERSLRSDDVSIFSHLEKSRRRNKVEGDYEGYWKSFKKELEFREDYDFFMEQYENGGSKDSGRISLKLVRY